MEFNFSDYSSQTFWWVLWVIILQIMKELHVFLYPAWILYPNLIENSILRFIYGSPNYSQIQLFDFLRINQEYLMELYEFDENRSINFKESTKILKKLLWHCEKILDFIVDILIVNCLINAGEVKIPIFNHFETTPYDILVISCYMIIFKGISL